MEVRRRGVRKLERPLRLERQIGKDFWGMDEKEKIFQDLSDDKALQEIAAELQKQVEEEKPEAFWQLAKMYEGGRVVKRDLKRAFQLRKRGFELRDPNATVMLAYSYEFAVGIPYDHNMAQLLYKQALTLAENFETRPFALCQLAAAEIDKYVQAVRLKVVDKNGEPGVAFEFVVEQEDKKISVATAFSLCQPVKSPFLSIELSDILRNNGEPKALCEKVAAGLITSAVKELQTLVAEGCGVAAGELADLYGMGNGVEKDDELACKLLNLAIECNYPPALVIVGNMNEMTGKNDDAKSLYKKAADLNDLDGICKLGMLENEASGDLASGALYFERAAKQGHAPSMYFLGSYLCGVGSYKKMKEGVDWLRQSAEKGFPLALERYAEYLENEARKDDPDFSWEKVARYYKEAMDANLSSAKVAYARLLYKGLGVKKDVEKAKKIFDEIKSGDDAAAKEELGLLKLENEPIFRDVKGGIELLADAGEERDTALVALGFHFFTGDVVPRNLRYAAFCFGKATVMNNLTGLSNFARCCLEGLGVQKDVLAGEYFLRAAAELGDPASAFRLAERFANGECGNVDFESAVKWYHVAAKSFNPVALDRLASCYWQGMGTRPDPIFALALWSLAVGLGFMDATEQLARANSVRIVAEALGTPRYMQEYERYAFLANAMERWLDNYRAAKKVPSLLGFIKEYSAVVEKFQPTENTSEKFRFDQEEDEEEKSPSPTSRLYKVLMTCCEPTFNKVSGK